MMMLFLFSVRMLAMGDNTNNRLFLDLDKPVEKSFQFKPVLDHVGEIKQIAVSKYCTLGIEKFIIFLNCTLTNYLWQILLKQTVRKQAVC